MPLLESLEQNPTVFPKKTRCPDEAVGHRAIYLY
jgi:hypothetical protein